jgi:hypothetical protein
MELKNRFRSLIIRYSDKHDQNITGILDELNDKKILNAMDDHKIIIQYVKKKGSVFSAELIDLNGDTKSEATTYTDTFFSDMFDAVDNEDHSTSSGNLETLSTESVVGLDEISTNKEDQDLANKMQTIKRLSANQEVDSEPIGKTYDGYTKVNKTDYWKMKSKYLKLKNKLINPR